MISEKMKPFMANNSAIRAMFEEGKRMAAIYGKENVYDFSLGNPNVPVPQVTEAILDVVKNEDFMTLHGYMSNAGYEDVRQTIAESLNKNLIAASTPGVSYGEKEAIASYIWNLMEKEDRGRPQWYYTKIGTHAYIAKIYRGSNWSVAAFSKENTFLSDIRAKEYPDGQSFLLHVTFSSPKFCSKLPMSNSTVPGAASNH